MTAHSLELLFASLLAILTGNAQAEGPAGPPPGRPGPGAPGPWNRDVLVYRATPDGAVERVAVFERAGVPTIARLKDGRLIAAHQHFPEDNGPDFDKVAVRFSADNGRTWSGPKVITVAGFPGGMKFPFDPTLVPLPDGRVRLYFTSMRGRTFESDAPAIYSAISEDGVGYAFERGTRFGIEGRVVIDCAAALHKGVFHLFAPDNGPSGPRERRPGPEPPGQRPREGVGYHAISQDGLRFTRVADVRIEGRRRWLGNAQSDGALITFYGTGEPFAAGGPPRGGLWMATSEDGRAWRLVPSPAIWGADPGAATARDGSLIIAITGEPRPGTPSARQRRPAGPPQPMLPGMLPGGPPAPYPPQPGPFPGAAPIRVERVVSRYRVAPGATKGWFATGQDADIMLSGIDFNNSGGPLLFNHPTGLASDGKPSPPG